MTVSKPKYSMAQMEIIDEYTDIVQTSESTTDPDQGEWNEIRLEDLFT